MKLLKYTGLVLYSLWAYFWFFFIGIIVAFVFVFILIFVRRDPGRALYRWCYFYGVAWAFMAGVKHHIIGREHFKPGQPYIITGNHTVTGDMFPIPVVLNHIKYRPFGKIELQNIPILGFLFKHTLIFVDRSSPESRHRSIEVMKEKIQREGISILIFPEGTRNRTGKPLKEFYDGAFRVAIECQVPVIPMVLLDTDIITPHKSPLIHPTALTTRFLPPIDTRGMTLDDIEPLKEKVYHQMEQVIVEHWKRTRGYRV